MSLLKLNTNAIDNQLQSTCASLKLPHKSCTENFSVCICYLQ